jgi:hypothetical protein
MKKRSFIISNIGAIALTVVLGTSLSLTAQAASKALPGQPVGITKLPPPPIHKPPRPKPPMPHPKFGQPGYTGVNGEHAAPNP